MPNAKQYFVCDVCKWLAEVFVEEPIKGDYSCPMCAEGILLHATRKPSWVTSSTKFPNAVNFLKFLGKDFEAIQDFQEIQTIIEDNPKIIKLDTKIVSDRVIVNSVLIEINNALYKAHLISTGFGPKIKSIKKVLLNAREKSE